MFVWATVPQPRDVTHLTGQVTGVFALQGEAGPIMRVGVALVERRVEAGMRARVLGPATGDTVCLRHEVGRWTGMETFNITDMRFCNQPIATSAVD